MSPIAIESLPPPQPLGGAPPGPPPEASAFHAALDEEMARTAAAEGQTEQSLRAAQGVRDQNRSAVASRHRGVADELLPPPGVVVPGGQGANGALRAEGTAVHGAAGTGTGTGTGASPVAGASADAGTSMAAGASADAGTSMAAGASMAAGEVARTGTSASTGMSRGSGRSASTSTGTGLGDAATAAAGSTRAGQGLSSRAAGAPSAWGRPVRGAFDTRDSADGERGQVNLESAVGGGQAARGVDGLSDARSLQPRLQPLEPPQAPAGGRALPPRVPSGEGLHEGEAGGGSEGGPGAPPAEGSAEQPRLVRLPTDLGGSGQAAAVVAHGAAGAGPNGVAGSGSEGASSANSAAVTAVDASAAGKGTAGGASAAGAGGGETAVAASAAAAGDAVSTQAAGHRGAHQGGRSAAGEDAPGASPRSDGTAGTTQGAGSEAPGSGQSAGAGRSASGGDAAGAPVAAAQVEAPGDGPLGATLTAAEGVDLQDMIETIHATVELAVRQNASQARIALEPAELGEIRIHLSQSGEGLIARVTAGSEAATQALLAGRAELHHALSTLGTSLLRLDIGSSGYAAGEQQGRTYEAPGQGRAGRETAEEDSVPGAEAGAPVQSSGQALGELVDVLA